MKIPRLGLLDLALVVATVLAVWTRTPIGALGQQPPHRVFADPRSH